jgi:hypothetical protein
MLRHLVAATAAASALVAASAMAQSPAPAYPPTVYQEECQIWTAKLVKGIDVIGASPSQIAEARSALATAQSNQQSGQWYSCSAAAKAGMNALKAG